MTAAAREQPGIDSVSGMLTDGITVCYIPATAVYRVHHAGTGASVDVEAHLVAEALGGRLHPRWSEEVADTAKRLAGEFLRRVRDGRTLA